MVDPIGLPTTVALVLPEGVLDAGYTIVNPLLVDGTVINPGEVRQVKPPTFEQGLARFPDPSMASPRGRAFWGYDRSGYGLGSKTQTTAVGATPLLPVTVLRLGPDRPITIGKVRFELDFLDESQHEWFGGVMDLLVWPWAMKKFEWSLGGSDYRALGPHRRSFEVKPGELNQLRFSTAEVRVAFDATDASFPDAKAVPPSPESPAGCGLALSAGYVTETAAVGRSTAEAHERSFIVPSTVFGYTPNSYNGQGKLIGQVTIHYAGLSQTFAATPEEPLTFVTNRLDVKHLRVPAADGSLHEVAGTFAVAEKSGDGTFKYSPCVFPTQAGIELLAGTYEVTSSTQTAEGTFSHKTVVTFP